MKEERISNYVKLCEEWAQRFLKMDQADLHKRVPELKEENGFLTIIHFGRRYGVSLEDGSIRSLDGQREPDTTEMLNIYTLLGYAKEGAFIMDKWVPFCRSQECKTICAGVSDRRDGCVQCYIFRP